MAKTREWICPICNSDDATEVSNGFEDMVAYSHMRCDECGAEWDDNFSVQYCGYNIETEDGDTKIYNAEGKRLKLYEVEVTGDCLASITKSYSVEASNSYEARLKAKEEFKADIEARNDVTEVLGITFGYTGVLKQ